MRRVVRSGAAFFMIAAVLMISPHAAHAATGTGTDPTGDVSLDGTYDITSVTATVTTSTVTIAVTTATAPPAFTDSTWASSLLTSGRLLWVGFAPALGSDGFYLDRSGLYAVDHRTDDINTDCVTTRGLSGSTITMSAPASCFGNPGALQVEVTMSKGLIPAAGEADVAIAPRVENLETLDPHSITTINAALPGGYYQLGSDGGIFAFGDAAFYGSTGNLHLNSPVVGMSVKPDGTGYRFVAGDGGVFSYNAGFYGSMGGKHLNKPIVGIATTPSGNGYWLVASDGGIFAYGDAAFYGSMGGQHLNKPIIGMAPTSAGYLLYASDGGIFAFGNAKFYGSTGSTHLNSSIVGLAPTSAGYYLAAADGGIFAYGNATFQGSGVNDFDNDVVGIGTDNTLNGYYLAGKSGVVRNYGSELDFGDISRYLESMGGGTLNSPIAGIAVKTAAG